MTTTVCCPQFSHVSAMKSRFAKPRFAAVQPARIEPSDAGLGHVSIAYSIPADFGVPLTHRLVRAAAKHGGTPKEQIPASPVYGDIYNWPDITTPVLKPGTRILFQQPGARLFNQPYAKGAAKLHDWFPTLLAGRLKETFGQIKATITVAQDDDVKYEARNHRNKLSWHQKGFLNWKGESLEQFVARAFKMAKVREENPETPLEGLNPKEF